jgi:hypothetical protein
MTENGRASVHRHTVIIVVRVPEYPEPVRVVGVLLHENGVSFAVIDRIGTGTVAILPDKIQLDPSLLRSGRALHRDLKWIGGTAFRVR